MTNSRVIIHPDMPRTAPTPIYAKLDNHSSDQPAHMVWPHLASPLFLAVLQHHWLAINSSKHCTSPNLRSFTLFLLDTILFPSSHLPFSTWLLSFSLISNITSSERGLVQLQDREGYTPCYTLLYISSIALIVSGHYIYWSTILLIFVNPTRLEVTFLV